MSIWEREKEREQIWRFFDRGTNLALFASRRLGKTWLMRKLEQEAKEKGYTAVFIDLEAETSTKGAVRKLCRTISEKPDLALVWKQIRSRLTDIIQGDTEAGNYQELLLKTNWESMLNVTLEALDAAEKPSLILIDEISVCLSSLLAVNEAEGKSFIHRLREHRQKFKNIRWMLTGSLGLDHIAEQYKETGGFNDLVPVLLNSFTPDQAQGYVDDLCRSRNLPLLSLEVHQSIQKRLGWLVPNYISHLFDRIEDQSENNGDNKDISLDDVESACKSLLAYPYYRVFSDWPDHINRNYPDEYRTIAHQVLKILCQHSDGETIDTLRNTQQIAGFDIQEITNTLIFLKNDGFLCLNPDTKKYSFVFGLLREYWKE